MSASWEEDYGMDRKRPSMYGRGASISRTCSALHSTKFDANPHTHPFSYLVRQVEHRCDSHRRAEDMVRSTRSSSRYVFSHSFFISFSMISD